MNHVKTLTSKKIPFFFFKIIKTKNQRAKMKRRYKADDDSAGDEGTNNEDDCICGNISSSTCSICHGPVCDDCKVSCDNCSNQCCDNCSDEEGAHCSDCMTIWNNCGKPIAQTGNCTQSCTDCCELINTNISDPMFCMYVDNDNEQCNSVLCEYCANLCCICGDVLCDYCVVKVNGVNSKYYCQRCHDNQESCPHCQCKLFSISNKTDMAPSYYTQKNLSRLGPVARVDGKTMVSLDPRSKCYAMSKFHCKCHQCKSNQTQQILPSPCVVCCASLKCLRSIDNGNGRMRIISNTTFHANSLLDNMCNTCTGIICFDCNKKPRVSNTAWCQDCSPSIANIVQQHTRITASVSMIIAAYHKWSIHIPTGRDFVKLIIDDNFVFFDIFCKENNSFQKKCIHQGECNLQQQRSVPRLTADDMHQLLRVV